MPCCLNCCFVACAYVVVHVVANFFADFAAAATTIACHAIIVACAVGGLHAATLSDIFLLHMLLMLHMLVLLLL